MFVIYQEGMKKPVRVWLEGREQIEESCLQQAYHLADLPFLHKWVCLMPDTHTGKGMPIGGVIRPMVRFIHMTMPKWTGSIP